MTAICYACVSPHPPIIIPEVGRGREKEVWRTLQALSQVARELETHAPQVAVLMATHGPLRPDAFALLVSPWAEGDFSQWGAYQVRLRFPVDLEAAQAISEEAARDGLPIWHVRDWDLDWSCTVPLYYLRPGLKDARLVVMNVSFLSPREHFRLGQAVRRALDKMGRPAAIIASADLSHRLSPAGPYGFDPAGPELDRRLEEAMARWDVELLLSTPNDLRERAGDDAVPSLSFLMGALDDLAVRPRVLSHEGPWGVGYMVVAVEVGEEGKPSHPLVRLAKEAVETYILKGERVEPNVAPEALAGLPEQAGVFVSIKRRDGSLRGCIGTTVPTCSNLAQEVVDRAIESATNDPRFLPVTPQELKELEYSVDVLSPLERVNGPQELDPKRYGVLVKKGARKGLLLPDLPGVETVEQQLEIAKAKAGIGPEEEDIELYRFTVVRLT